MTLHQSLEEGARAFPDRCWLRFEDTSWSYAEGNALCEKIARGLVEQGVRPGDRVGLLFANSPELVFCYFACFKAGAVAVPFNTRFQIAESIYALNHCGAKILIGQPDLIAPLLKAGDQLPGLDIFVTGSALADTHSLSALIREAPVPLPVVASGQLAVVLYTSGTTSRPKGVMHSHATLRRQSANYLEVLGADTYAQCLLSLPLNAAIGRVDR